MKAIQNDSGKNEFQHISVDIEAVKLPCEEGIQKAILNLLNNGLNKNCYDAVMIPHKIPSNDSYVYLLIQDTEVLSNATPIAPVMPIQGGRALSSITKSDTGGLRIMALLRPCEVRAAIELSKMDQSVLDDVTLLSYDCPGVLPTKVYISDPKNAEKDFENAMDNTDDGPMRPSCKVCFTSNSALGDLHVGRFGNGVGNILIIPKSMKGKALLDELGMKTELSTEKWKEEAEKISQEKMTKRIAHHEKLKEKHLGLRNLLDTFSPCVGCHCCIRVCPIDSCPRCYFESNDVKYPPEDYIQRSQNTGSLRFPPDTLMYHLGRMLHMTLSCVSCGTCEDACPMSIPISQIYNSVADEVQGLFDYLAGRNPEESRPLTTFQLKEFAEMEG